MKANLFRDKSESELNVELLGLLKYQFALRMRYSTQQLTNNSEIKKVRRDVARLRTVLREMQK